MDPSDSPNPNRTPISHPYPPSYRSRMSSNASQSQQGSPASVHAQQVPLPPPAGAGYVMNYQRRRDQRHHHPQQQQSSPFGTPPRQQQHHLSYNDPYANYNSSPNRPSDYNSHDQDQRGAYGYGGRGNAPAYSNAPSPDPSSRLTQPLRDRSPSDASLPPGDFSMSQDQTLSLGVGPSGAGGLKRSASVASRHPALKWFIGRRPRPIDEVPEGWTKEDEEAERVFTKQGMFNWNDMRSWRFWIRKEWWLYYLLAIILGVLVALMAIFHDEIVNWLQPVANWMKNLPAGWVIPIVILFVISFPPLFGHEIVGILIGAVWGLWVGFGIVSAGTLLGELGNFWAFKWILKKHADKYEKKNFNYKCLAQVVREGGFFFIFVVRLSAIPGHFTTAVFATCGMSIWVFTLAAVLTLPKQLIVVYLGVMFNEQDTDTKSKIISDFVLGIGFLVTIWAAYYVYREMNKVRLPVWRQLRMEEKQLALTEGKTVVEGGGAAAAAGDGNKRHSYKEYPTVKLPRDEEAEMRSPMIERHQSYQNPYNIRYQPTNDNMSVYEVDGPLQPRPEAERDIGYANPPYASTETISNDPYSHQAHQAAYGNSGSESFPEAHPTSGAGVRRELTSSTMYAGASPRRGDHERQETLMPTNFPVAHPNCTGGPGMAR